MLKKVIPIVLLGLCLIAGVCAVFFSGGCLEPEQKAQIKKDVLALAGIAVQYKLCTDDANKAVFKDQLRDKVQDLAKRYGKGVAVIAIKRLQAKGKIKEGVAGYLLDKLDTSEDNEDSEDEPEPDKVQGADLGSVKASIVPSEPG